MKILFVCLGNICRSAAAEAVLKAKLQLAELMVEVDSAGTGAYHVGEMADDRMCQAALRRGYRITSISRQITQQDLAEFNWIVTMDDCNYQHVWRMFTDAADRTKLYRLVDFCQCFKRSAVPDPYYGDADGFNLVLDILEDGCDGMVGRLQEASRTQKNGYFF